jgi:carbon storage regulator CsrA
MLILTVKDQSEVHIDGPCIVVVLKDKQGKMKLGFKADKSVKVLRGELLAKGAA